MLKIVSRVLVIIINIVVGLMMVEIIKVVIKLKKNRMEVLNYFFRLFYFLILKIVLFKKEFKKKRK